MSVLNSAIQLLLRPWATSKVFKITCINKNYDEVQSTFNVSRGKIKGCDSQILGIIKEQAKINHKIREASLEKKRKENKALQTVMVRPGLGPELVQGVGHRQAWQRRRVLTWLATKKLAV